MHPTVTQYQIYFRSSQLLFTAIQRPTANSVATIPFPIPINVIDAAPIITTQIVNIRSDFLADCVFDRSVFLEFTVCPPCSRRKPC